MGNTFVGVLVRMLDKGMWLPPEQRPLGRAALEVEKYEITAVIGQQIRNGLMSGVIALPHRWHEVFDVPVCGVYDRFPSVAFHQEHLALVTELKGIPLVNPLSITLLCRDKLKCQRVLEKEGIPMPPVEENPSKFAEAVYLWGKAFLKPRFGALGEGVRLMDQDSILPRKGDWILQKAVLPPEGFAGICLRVLVQKETDSGWVIAGMALRMSKSDPVVNAARGALVMPPEEVLKKALIDEAGQLSIKVAQVLSREPDAGTAGELGVDLVVSSVGELFVIEVNGKPLGRLENLARIDSKRFLAMHLAACTRPLRWTAFIAKVLNPVP